MLPFRARGQRGITLIEIVLWCAIISAATVAVFVFSKKASVTAAVETEQRQVEDIVKTVEGLFATQPNFAALGTNGAQYLQERAARSGLKFETNEDGTQVLASGLGSGALTLSAWDAVPPSGPTVPNSGYRLAYQGLADGECTRLVTATYPIAYQVRAGHEGLNDTSATLLATRGQFSVSPAVIAETCAARDAAPTVFLYFFPARAIATATTATPPPASRCAPVHETQNVSCPAGQIGAVTQERDGACTGPGNTMVYTVWTTTNDTCQNPATPPPTVTPPTSPDNCAITTFTRVLACAIGETGQRVQSRQHDSCAGTNTPWVTDSNSCQTATPVPTCTPQTQQLTSACPAGQGGQRVQSRSSTCTSPTAAPTWSAWETISNTCTASCSQGGANCCTVQRQQQTVPTACPAGTYGNSGADQERFLGCADAMTQSATWTAWQTLTTTGSCTSCPATTTETNLRWDPRTDACPSGQTGSITYEAEQVQTRDVSYNCPAGTTALPAPSATAWSAWADTGASRNVVNTCVAAAAITCSPGMHEPWMGFGSDWRISEASACNTGDKRLALCTDEAAACSPDLYEAQECVAGKWQIVSGNVASAPNAWGLTPLQPWNWGAIKQTTWPTEWQEVFNKFVQIDSPGWSWVGCSSGAAPVTCTIPAFTVFTWTQGAETCSSSWPIAQTLNAFTNHPVSYNDGVKFGDAKFACRADGTMSPTPIPGATCNVVAAACTGSADETRWTATTGTCPSGETGTHTWDREQSRSRTCNAGTWSAWSAWSDTGATTNDTNTCAPSACSGNASEAQWLNSNAACPATTWGTHTWEREQTRTRTCNAGTWSAFGLWTDSGVTRNENNACVACPGNTTETQTQWLASSAACPSGQTGSHTWEREQSNTRSVTYSCPVGTTASPSPTYGAWSGWVDTGVKRNESNTCAAASTLPSCPAVDVGLIDPNPYDTPNEMRTCDASMIGWRALHEWGISSVYNTREWVCTVNGWEPTAAVTGPTYPDQISAMTWTEMHKAIHIAEGRAWDPNHSATNGANGISYECAN